MFNCPNCKKPTIPFWKKFFIDVRYKFRCKECNALINIPYWAAFLNGLVTICFIYILFDLLESKQYTYCSLVIITYLIYLIIYTINILIIKK